MLTSSFRRSMTCSLRASVDACPAVSSSLPPFARMRSDSICSDRVVYSFFRIFDASFPCGADTLPAALDM